MAIELWAASSAVLLALAVAAWVVQVLQVRGPWPWIATSAKVAAVLSLAIALVLTLFQQGGWSPEYRSQVMLGLTLAMLVAYLLLAWKPEQGAASPAVELLGVALILVGVLTVQATEPALGLMQRATPYYAQWVLFLLGAGAALVAGCTALTLTLHSAGRARVSKQRPEQRAKEHALLKRATTLSVGVLGVGLAVSAWWTWRTMGTLSSADPGEGWLVIGWLGAAMSLISWRLERRWELWAVGFGMVAAVLLLLGVVGSCASCGLSL